MKLQLTSVLLGSVLGFVSDQACAHFLVVYTPQTALLRGTEMPFHLIFTHAFHGGPSMALDKPLRFYYAKQAAPDEKSEEVDLSQYLEPIQWQADNGTVSAWRATLPRTTMRSLGDYQVVVEPTPFLETNEDIYIQQFTKVMVNVGGVPGNWAATLGLPAEIAALNKPYANWTGSVFRGVVLGEGKPVPFTQVEVEYLNHALDTTNNRFAEAAAITAPHPALEAMVILTDANGEFAFSLPKAGWWGFAALKIGPVTTYNGKPLSQDAVLWVQATDLPP
jgi:cobalt/nickel transport protein